MLSTAASQLAVSTAKYMYRTGSFLRESAYENAWKSTVIHAKKEAVKIGNNAVLNFYDLTNKQLPMLENNTVIGNRPSINCFALAFVCVKVRFLSLLFTKTVLCLTVQVQKILERKAKLSRGGMNRAHANSWLKRVKDLKESIEYKQDETSTDHEFGIGNDVGERFRAVLNACDEITLPPLGKIESLDELT